MKGAAEPQVQIEEVTTTIVPAPGVSLEQAVADAQLIGYQKLAVKDGKIIVTWFRRSV
jgi:hypothetical protein